MTIRLPLTNGAQFVSGSAGGVPMSAQGGVALAQLGSLGVGATTNFTLTVQLNRLGEPKLDGQRQRRSERPPACEQPGNGHVAVAESPGVLDFASPSIVVTRRRIRPRHGRSVGRGTRDRHGPLPDGRGERDSLASTTRRPRAP